MLFELKISKLDYDFAMKSETINIGIMDFKRVIKQR